MTKFTLHVPTKRYDTAYNSALALLTCAYPKSYPCHYETFNSPTLNEDTTIDLLREDRTHRALGWMRVDSGRTVTKITVCLIK